MITSRELVLKSILIPISPLSNAAPKPPLPARPSKEGASKERLLHKKIVHERYLAEKYAGMLVFLSGYVSTSEVLALMLILLQFPSSVCSKMETSLPRFGCREKIGRRWTQRHRSLRRHQRSAQ